MHDRIMDDSRITFLEKRVRQLNSLALALALVVLILGASICLEGLAILDLKDGAVAPVARSNRIEALPVLSKQEMQLPEQARR